MDFKLVGIEVGKLIESRMLLNKFFVTAGIHIMTSGSQLRIIYSGK